MNDLLAAVVGVECAYGRISPKALARLKTKAVTISADADESLVAMAWKTLALSAQDDLSPLGYTDTTQGGERSLTIYWIEG